MRLLTLFALAFLLASCAIAPPLASFALVDSPGETTITIDGGNDTIINWVDFSLDRGTRQRDTSAPFERVYDESRLSKDSHRVDVWVSVRLLGSDSVLKRTKWFTADASPPPPPEPEPGRTLIFSDEFNDGTVDANKWSLCFPWRTPYGCGNASNRNEAVYLDRNVTESGGNLHLTARREDVTVNGKTWHYTSGMVSSYGKFDHTYGYMEFRADVPCYQGAWPALWNHSSRDYGTEWPPEIDVMESINENGVLEMHYHYDGGSFGAAYDGTDICQGFHTYAVDWKPNSITWYLDGIERATLRRTTATVPMYLILNHGVGGVWPGPVSSSASFPQDMLIDYVRIYR